MHHLENGISGILSTRNIFCEEGARSELKAVEKYARYALLYQQQQFQITVQKYQ